MCLKAKRYPDIWIFSDDTPSPPPDYPKENRVQAFLDIFLTPKYFGRIIVWGYPSNFKEVHDFHKNKEQKGLWYRFKEWLLPNYVIDGYARYYQKVYNFDKDKGYRVIEYLYEAEAVELRYPIRKDTETGDFSILFISSNPDEFLKQILKKGHYGEPNDKLIGTNDKNDPLNWQYGRDIKFLKSNLFHEGERIFTFSHDAEYLYEIFR